MPRNQAPHFKVRCSMRNHRKTAGVYADNRLLAAWVRLGIYAVEVYADRTQDTFQIPDRALTALMGVGRADIARTSLGRLADVCGMSVERQGDVWAITWPNLAKKQFPRREDGTVRGGSASASASASGSGSSSESVLTSEDVDSSRHMGGPGGERLPPPARPKNPQTSSAEWIAKLARACPHGACDPGVVRAWLATIRPAIDARGYSDIRRAATSWWARVRPDELAAARTKAMREGLIAQPPLEVYVPPLSAAEGAAIIAAINRGEIPRSLES